MSAQTLDDDVLQPAGLAELLVGRLRAEILAAPSRGRAPGRGAAQAAVGTNHAPLRETLRLLGQQGLVEHLPRRGVRVVRLSRGDINELFALTTALGETPPPSPTAFARLLDALKDIVRASAGDAGADQAAAHREFHGALVALAGQRQLQRVYEPILLQLQLYMATNMRREAQVGPAAGGSPAAPATVRDRRGRQARGRTRRTGAARSRTVLAPELDGA